MHGNQPFFGGNTLVSPLGFCVYHVRSLFHCSRLHERTPNKHRVLAKIFAPARIREQTNKNGRVRSCSFAKRLFVYANSRHCSLPLRTLTDPVPVDLHHVERPLRRRRRFSLCSRNLLEESLPPRNFEKISSNPRSFAFFAQEE